MMMIYQPSKRLFIIAHGLDKGRVPASSTSTLQTIAPSAELMEQNLPRREPGRYVEGHHRLPEHEAENLYQQLTSTQYVLMKTFSFSISSSTSPAGVPHPTRKTNQI